VDTEERILDDTHARLVTLGSHNLPRHSHDFLDFGLCFI
jgi:hypothetical protein